MGFRGHHVVAPPLVLLRDYSGTAQYCAKSRGKAQLRGDDGIISRPREFLGRSMKHFRPCRNCGLGKNLHHERNHETHWKYRSQRAPQDTLQSKGLPTSPCRFRYGSNEAQLKTASAGKNRDEGPQQYDKVL